MHSVRLTAHGSKNAQFCRSTLGYFDKRSHWGKKPKTFFFVSFDG